MAIDLDLLLRAYSQGYFPMSDGRDDPEIFWVEPKRRAILPLDGLNMSRSLAKIIRQDRFRVTSDAAFERVIAACAQYAQGREDTWINAQIEEAFTALHHRGLAHSIECWVDDPGGGSELVGGLYGLALGGAFFGESMFSRASDASKTALVWLVARLRVGGFRLLDCQFMTDHLASLGAVEISQAEYLRRLALVLPRAGVQMVGAGVLSPLRAPAAGVSAPAPPLSVPPLSAPPSSAPAPPDWSALDALLSSPAAGGGVSMASSSPGKLILHSFTQTS